MPSKILSLPDILLDSPQAQQIITDGIAGLEEATNDIAIYDMANGDVTISSAEQQRAFVFQCDNTVTGNKIVVNDKIDFVTEARRFMAIKNSGPGDLKVENVDATFTDTIPGGGTRLYYIKGKTVSTLGAFAGTISALGTEFEVNLYISGKPPAGNVEVLRVPFTTNVRFEANFLGSKESHQVNATGSVKMDVKRDGTKIGDITIPAGVGNTLFTTVTNNPYVFSAGSILTVESPLVQDATLSSVGINFRGTKF